MNHLVTTAIVLSRTNYGEADRIITVITPDQGKLRLMARGVRRVNAKLAGGVELFSVSTITFMRGKGDIGTLVSARLIRHFNQIAKDLDRTMLGYDVIKQLNRVIEDEADESWYSLIERALEALNDPKISINVVRFWFSCQLLSNGGYVPNLKTDEKGENLSETAKYTFDGASMSLKETNGGRNGSNQVKFLRLGFSGSSPKAIQRVKNADDLSVLWLNDLRAMIRDWIQV